MAAFVSRVTHTLSTGVLFSYAVGPFLWRGGESLALQTPLLLPVLAGLALLSGLYNAGRAQPSTFKRAGAYRLAVYAKVPLLALFTPVAAQTLGERTAVVRLAVAVLLYVLGARARFVREAETLAVKKL